ncbi:MAG: SDR family oxidoreductase [Fimbriimonas sp.]|nr:SDR family oxidoreductase [Fimbriimonas sp.]
MTNTILITGASSGIGRATAKHFHAKGWNVIATMRNPEREDDLTTFENTLVTRLDVLETASIDQAAASGIERFGRIDVLLNNAGYGAYGPLEAFDIDGIRRQFDTNVIGLLAVTKSVLPHMRANRSGTIINISSIGGKMAFPLGTLYHGTKFAVEGLSEALRFELDAIGVKVKIVEPGSIKTDYIGRSFDFRNDESMTEYQAAVRSFLDSVKPMTQHASPPELVADVIYGAATDGSHQLRYAAGEDARQLIANRKTQDDDTLFSAIKSQMGL